VDRQDLEVVAARRVDVEGHAQVAVRARGRVGGEARAARGAGRDRARDHARQRHVGAREGGDEEQAESRRGGEQHTEHGEP
jgi:hypothetical protein